MSHKKSVPLDFLEDIKSMVDDSLKNVFLKDPVAGSGKLKHDFNVYPFFQHATSGYTSNKRFLLLYFQFTINIPFKSHNSM